MIIAFRGESTPLDLVAHAVGQGALPLPPPQTKRETREKERSCIKRLKDGARQSINESRVVCLALPSK